jgi:tetratricopeptide (TPR) repeat protein
MLTRLIATILLTSALLLAHAGIDERIKDMNQRVAADPDNAELYVKRGELHRLHRDWPAALADYQRAENLASESHIIWFVRGRMYYEAGRLPEAKIELDRLLSAAPDHQEGLVTRARLLTRLDQPLQAAHDYDVVIAGLVHPTPEFYLERAKALVASGPQQAGRALDGLDEGIRRLGPLFTLVDFAIELEVQSARYDAALRRLDQQLGSALAPERLFYRRGTILSLSGRAEEARKSYVQALGSLRTAPIRRRSTRAAKDFEAELLGLVGE